MSEITEKEIEAAIKAFQMAHTAKVDIPLEQSMRDALEAAARVRAEADAGEPVAWPKIMYVCENCLECNPEMCGHDRRDIYVTPDGRWLCDSCIDGEGISSRDCTTPPMLYAHPAPQPSRVPISLADAEKAFLDRVWPRLQSGCYRAHGSMPVEIRGLDFNEFIRDGLCAVLEATDPQPSEKTEEAAQIIQTFIDQGIDYIKRNNRVEEALHHLKIIEGEANRVTNPVTKNNLLYEIERIRSALTAAKPEQEGAALNKESQNDE